MCLGILVSGCLSCFQFEAFSGLNICVLPIFLRASQVVLVVKDLPDNVGEVRDMGWIPGLGRSPGEGHGSPLSILAWRIPGMGEPGGLPSMGSHRVRHD